MLDDQRHARLRELNAEHRVRIVSLLSRERRERLHDADGTVSIRGLDGALALRVSGDVAGFLRRDGNQPGRQHAPRLGGSPELVGPVLPGLAQALEVRAALGVHGNVLTLDLDGPILEREPSHAAAGILV